MRDGIHRGRCYLFYGNAALAVVNSTLAKGALSTAAATIPHYTAEAGKLGLKSTVSAAKCLWSWGTIHHIGTNQTSSFASQAVPAA